MQKLSIGFLPAPILACLLCAGAAPTPACAEQAPAGKIDTGTDPTRLSRQFQATYEHLRLKGGLGSDTLKLNLTLPFGERQDYSLRARLPVTRVTGLGGVDRFDIGDASLMLTHVFGLNAEGGNVVQAEWVADTAARPELGSGKHVLKGTFIHAWFLPGGAIFAPALMQTVSVAGQSDRADLNQTTLDLYYVPKLADPRDLITFDPSVVRDWQNHLQFAGLAVTYGRVLGKVLGGSAIVSVKPSILMGGDRPGSWGLEVGFKVIGF